MQTFLEFQCLVDYLVGILELSMFINASLSSCNILFDKVERVLGNEKKKSYCEIPFISFFLKTFMNDLI